MFPNVVGHIFSEGAINIRGEFQRNYYFVTEQDNQGLAKMCRIGCENNPFATRLQRVSVLLDSTVWRSEQIAG